MQADQKLTGIRDIKAIEVENYFSAMAQKIRVLADSAQVSKAMAAFPNAVNALPSTNNTKQIAKDVEVFYQKNFYAKYASSAAVTSKALRAAPLVQLLPKDPISNHLQSLYIVNNPHHVGDKWRLQDTGDKSLYSRIHHNIHPWMQNYQSHMQFYDLFFIGLDGRILYSVFKEVDFGTSLTTGPWRNSNLAKLYHRLIKDADNLPNLATKLSRDKNGQKSIAAKVDKSEQERVFYQDTAFYGPSYNNPGAFLGTRVYGDDGKLLGFLAAQFSQQILDNTLGLFQGMGDTTETIIISSNDFLLRSNSRFRDGDSLLMQRVDTTATRASAAGETGIKHTTDYMGNPTLIAHRPLNIPDLNWSLNAKMDTAEFEAGLADSRTMMMWATLIAGVLSIIVVLILIYSLKHRIDQVSRRAHKIALGDLSHSNSASFLQKDELSVVEKSLIDIRRSLQELVKITKNIAVGDVSQRLDKRSQEDSLVEAINQLAGNASEAAQVADSVAKGDLDTEVRLRSDHDMLGLALRKMIGQLKHSNAVAESRNWVVTGIGQLNETVRGDQSIDELAENIIRYACQYLNVGMGAIYLAKAEQDEQVLVMKGSYAYSFDPQTPKQYRWGEHLVGQAAQNGIMIHLNQIPDSYPEIASGLGSAPANNLYLMPFKYNGVVIGLAELATHQPLNETDMRFLGLCEEVVAVAFHTAQAHQELDEALMSSQAMTEELQSQQEELQDSNQQLEEQTLALKISQKEVEERNSRLQVAQSELNARAEQLTQSSKYKSEFLANMSHE